MWNDVINKLKMSETKKIYFISAGVGILALISVCLWRNMMWVYMFGLLTISCCFIGPLVIILIHIALSPKHQTGAGTAKTVMELEAFRTMLMVCN